LKLEQHILADVEYATAATVMSRRLRGLPITGARRHKVIQIKKSSEVIFIIRFDFEQLSIALCFSIWETSCTGCV
jgi:hypothetical protein